MRRKQRDNRMLRAGHYTGLKFDEGWWFVQVLATEYNEVKPVVMLNENDNRDVIAAGTAATETDEVEDGNNNKILEPTDDDRNTIFQLMYGVAPSRIQMFELYGRDRNRAVQDYDEPGDPAPAVSGYDSPYNNPSRESELFYVNSMSPLRLQAFNPMDESTEARLSFHVNKMRYATVTDKSLMKAMLQGQQPARLATLGGGVQDRNQVGIPTWVREAYSEHIHSTEEILSDSRPGSNRDTVRQGASNLQGNGGGQ